MPAEVLFDMKLDHLPVATTPPARSFRLALAAVLATLSAVALAFVGNPIVTITAGISPVMVAAPAIAAVDPDAADAQSVQLARDDERDIDALTSAVARRYRVSDEAIRDVVQAAFKEARRNRLDPLLVVSIIAIESRFNPFAQSGMGALGLMQVIPQYHADKFDEDGESMLDPRVNIRVGARILQEYIARAGNEAAGLQRYSGGSDGNGAAYAHKVALEKQRLQAAMRRVRPQAAPIA